MANALVVRETVCRSILNRSGISDYSLNCYTGCTHACVYCYARYMQRFHPHQEPWGEFVDVKVNAVEALKRQLRRAAPGEVFVSSACDGWQPIEAERRLTRRCCELLLEHGFTVNVLTKSALVLRDLDVLTGRVAWAKRSVPQVPERRVAGAKRSVPQVPGARVGVTVTTLDETLAALWEPAASTVAERFRVIEEARQAGVRTAIMFGPLLPYLSDSQESIDALLERAGDLGIDVIWVDALNRRPRVWPAVARLLRERFPDLHDRYQRLLFDENTRAAYLEELGIRVARAAERLSLTERVRSCV
jgi:DNA repair photolyase